MPTFNYDPPAFVQESGTLWGGLTIGPAFECVGFERPFSALYNQNLCFGAECYYEPVASDDVIYLQTRFPLIPGDVLEVRLVDALSNSILGPIATQNAGMQWSAFILNNMFRQNIYLPVVTLPDYFAIRVTHNGKDYYSDFFWRYDVCGCNDETVRFTAETEGPTCLGNWAGGYEQIEGNAPAPFNYVPRVRVFGKLRRTSTQITPEKSGGASLTTTSFNQYAADLEPTPGYIADRLREVLSGRITYANGRAVLPDGAITFDEINGDFFRLNFDLQDADDCTTGGTCL